MNIRAKISQSSGKRSASARKQAPEEVNEPLGEAYSAYWNWWLKRFAEEAEKRFPDIFEKPSNTNGCASDPLDRIDRLFRARGCDAIFGLSRALGRPSGFDVASFVITGSASIPKFVKNWSGLIRQQADIRFPSSGREIEFLATEGVTTLVLSPYQVRPANQKPFGPAMLAGVVAGTLEAAGYDLEGIWSLTRGGQSKPILRFGMFLGDSIDFDSDIVIRVSPERAAQRRTASALPATLTLNHLMRSGAGFGSARLLSRIVAQMEMAGEELPTLVSSAETLGLSARSLSRRLQDAGVGFARLTRFVRLRTSTRLIAESGYSLDDIAYLSAYSDRHHMAREFRKMAQVTPAGLRDLFKG